MAGKLFIRTFGCQMNEYDSSKMAEVLADSHQLEVTDIPEEADVLLLNTCSIREKAQEKVFHQLGRWKRWKDSRPNLVIGVGGCVASQEGDAIRKRAPYVDLIFGPQTLHRLPAMLEEVKISRKPSIDISFPEIEKFDNLPAPRAEGPSAFVSVMEGCSKYCTFCVVPYTRGEEVSRPVGSVLREIRQLAAQGVREVNLLGQNVNAYQGVLEGEETADLALLIHYVAAIEGIERIRFTTSHPVEFSDSLIEAFAEVPELVNHLHLPVQSGSDRILQMMKRGHTAKEYLEKIRRVKEIRPDLSMSSDFIIGFPNETEADFQATMDLINEVEFDHSFSFIYSARPGTPAAAFVDSVPEDVKKERLKIMQTRLLELENMHAQSMVGTTQVILVEREAHRGDGDMAGRTENNRVVNFQGDASLIGQFVEVRIEEAFSNSLRGELLTASVTAQASGI
ncbi:tRNA (N6-isopentenyl adenosine(37)-C2)-methylthiotransferase MiaB [Methylophaga sp.]|uniref:tRNA (N6-isopentenyl adenosine(37)-C2)-methylthiotransferase MiaB n=1 Tax=Methylophaga sp. TaxID=2024840 RepID=UPI003F696FD7